MNSIIEFFVRYKIWANVLMISIFGFGFLSLTQMRFSFFPEIEPNIISAQVAYPGASPEEVEEGVILKIEENLDGLTGIEQITSVSRENFGTVTIEIVKGADVDLVLADVKNAIDRISAFPLGAERPVIFKQNFRSRSLSIMLYGETDLFNLKYIADDLREELLATPEISQVSISGLPSLEFSIEVLEKDMRRFQMSFDEIANAVAASNVNISGGKFETRDEEILIRAYGRRYFAREMEDIPIRGNPDGTVIYLRDVASVQEIWEDTPDKIYYNDRNAVILNLDQTEQEDILLIAQKPKKWLRILITVTNRFRPSSWMIVPFPLLNGAICWSRMV
jgi:multidrug efflux pump subunit AcrB